ncbi:adenylate/guanylate cyclase domain-containing protein [Acuticoccus mangrovi]|uniref:Adenylate/guanylate cyclase domain-containing protein n=1 Tax=Acuticoccus mangrovi TaxID=2796142 RepID=A0A934MH65_9HYPH|nr:adenylate/guanylate cyclase domain-containing protein [Acuticoccus mangrovi]MBJ3775736.1 adenylate/guanylate cyclase domain-containing protein [Acuticoccus mangrovi]
MREDAVLDWLVREGLAGTAEVALLEGFCERCIAAGLPLARSTVFVDMLDPSLEGRGAAWRDDAPAYGFEYGSTREGEGQDAWQRTPFFTLYEAGGGEMRVRLGEGERTASRMLESLAEEGMTDYVAHVCRIPDDTVIGEMDGVFLHFATRAEGGFSEAGLARLRRLVPALALALKSLALARVARTLAHVYLGHGAARTVLHGSILRGLAERIDTVLWFSDLRGYTQIAERADPTELIPLLNAYAAAAITAVHGAGGETLKFIGDGVLAVFRDGDRADCARRALDAEAHFRGLVREVSAARRTEGKPATSAYVALHVGEVYYGNIGARERLDFTVVGPAVNEVSRIAAMSRSVDRDLLVSEAFHDALAADLRERFVSAGRFVLRGVGEAQHLFTLDPALKSG